MTLERPFSLLITLGFLVAAIALYVVGLVLPGTVFFVLGIAAELAFWLRILRRK